MFCELILGVLKYFVYKIYGRKLSKNDIHFLISKLQFPKMLAYYLEQKKYIYMCDYETRKF